MCLSPIKIENPYRGLRNVGLNRFHDCSSAYLLVPCGNCSSCVALRQSYYVQRAQMESINHHLFMLTLTYNTHSLRYKVVNGRKLYYADFTDCQKMFKRLRNRGLKFSYMLVSEYGTERHRPHFHAIISVPKNKGDTYHDIMNWEYKLQDMFLGEWRRNYGSDTKPIYKPLCSLVVNHRGRNFDLHYIEPNATAKKGDDVVFYVSKYILKADKWVDRLKSALKLNLSPEEFEDVWKYLKPRCSISKNFGDYSSLEVKDHIRKGIELAKLSGSEFPYFIHPLNGQTFPLAPVYKRRFMTMEDLEHFFYMKDVPDVYKRDGYSENDEVTEFQMSVKSAKLDKIRDSVNSRLQTHSDLYVEEIYNFSPESLEENSSMADHSCDLVPDDWQSDFLD